MALTLPARPPQHFIDELLLPEWQSSDARGYNIQGVQPGDEDFMPVATSIDDVGAVYPSLVISFSSGSSGGDSTYDYLTPSGPGQERTVSLLATARAQDRESDYTGDSATYSAAEAEDIVVDIIEAVENVCQRNASPSASEFHAVGSQRASDAPDDLDEDPPVRIAQCEIRCSWLRSP